MLGAVVAALGDGAILALVATGLVLVFKGSRVLNLAQGEIGAFALLVVYVALGKQSAPGFALLAGATLLGGVLGIGTERLIMRPLVERPPIQSTIASLGLTVVLVNAAALNGTDGVLGFLPQGQNSYPLTMPPTAGRGSVVVAGATLVSGRLVALVATAAVGAALWLFFTRTRFGLAVLAATSDNTVARILGVPVRNVYRFTWGVGGALSGLAAALVASLGPFQPATMTFTLIGALAGAVIGGLDSVPGAIVGSLLVGVVQGLIKYHFPSVGGVENVAVLALVLVTLMVRPRGLLGGAGATA
ncbi:MAG TPA: branched-chain amino acid ABC transporter permease [Egibacteraceae bacterium]|nr:branched-chain amino acid ABC transporter permease [Egibacteraceae bacterium]